MPPGVVLETWEVVAREKPLSSFPSRYYNPPGKENSACLLDSPSLMVTSGCSLACIDGHLSFLLVTSILFRPSFHLTASGSTWIITDFPLASLSESASLKPDCQRRTHPHGRPNRHLKLAVVLTPISETFSG